VDLEDDSSSVVWATDRLLAKRKSAERKKSFVLMSGGFDDASTEKGVEPVSVF
jgi:hypothetical protein